MRCARCGHTLGNVSAVCPNCGALMNQEQLQERKEMNGASNPYMQKIQEVQQRKLWNNSSSSNQTTNKNMILAIGVILLGVLAIIAILLLV